MSRNKHFSLLAGLALLASLVFASVAAAAERSIALVLGDVESRPAAIAVARMGPELEAAGVKVRVITGARVSDAERRAVAGAEVALVNAVDVRALQGLASELKARRDAGAPTLALGAGAERLEPLGISLDPALDRYYRAGGSQNFENLLRRVLRTRFGARVDEAPVRQAAELGAYDPVSGQVHDTFDSYRAGYARFRPGAPWVGVVFYRASLVADQLEVLKAVTARLEADGFNVLPVFGYPYEEPLRRFFLDDAGASRVDVLVALGMKVGATAGTSAILERIGAPVINAITLSNLSEAEWRASAEGLSIVERSWQLSGPELAGEIQPTVVGARERIEQPDLGVAFVEERPIAERIARLSARVKAWSRLRHAANREKRVAVLYFNYPHGSETIGAAYLNVLPESLWSVLGRLKADGYAVTGEPASPRALQHEIQTVGAYPGKETASLRKGLAALDRSGEALRIPLEQYRAWYDALPAKLRQHIEHAWGPPERAFSLLPDARGGRRFVFPLRRYGNLVLAPQPTRAWEQNLEKLHNEVSLPPSHEYVAFYLWLQHGFRADAVVHVGTHGTHEWLSGREAGLGEDDPSEALIGALPNIYPYVMDDVGEGLQAKRRGGAVIVDHLTPPFDAAGLSPDLRELAALLNDYRVALQKSPTLAGSHLQAMNALAQRTGALKAIGVEAFRSEADLEALEEFIDSAGDKLTPFGLHTFGRAPAPEAIAATARAIVGLEQELTPEEAARRVAALEVDIAASGTLELDRFMAALNGRYVPPGPGADLLRNPAALPTGRNFFGLDPARIPGRATFEEGRRLADALAADYRERHGAWPEKLTMSLWGVETQRHEGAMEAQAMALMGVRPRWDERGRVLGVELIPTEELARPRVDVVMVASGLFRDMFPNILKLLDEAARLAQSADAGGNPLAAHSAAIAAGLQGQGVSEAEARRLASVRIFGLPSGAYGTNIEKLIPLTNSWRDEKEVADLYIRRMNHPYGAGYWGGEPEAGGEPLSAAARDAAFRGALSGSQVALHSRSSNLFATLDNDDFFQYLGGAALAVRSIDGKSPELVVSDLANPRAARQVSLERYMGEELQARYLNPKWADRMLKEGYSGARFINRVTDYLFAWQVTAPDSIDDAAWQGLYDTYVADRHGLEVKRRFQAAGNLKAYQAMLDRMLTAVERGYWDAPAEVRRRLAAENRAAIQSGAAACEASSCSRASRAAGAAPALNSSGRTARAAGSPPAPARAPAESAAEVSGFRMTEVSRVLARAPAKAIVGGLLAAAAGFVVLGLFRAARR